MSLRIVRSRQKYWSVHTHSRYSHRDALPTPAQIVARAKELRYEGIALTDHGNMAGSVELYQESMRAGIRPFPGSELYVVIDRGDTRAKRMHLGVVAYTTEGYRNLINLSTLSHRNFYHRPLLDLSDLAGLAEDGRTRGIAVTTGCHFGLVPHHLIHHGEDAARRMIRSLETWFPGAVYVELQNHEIERQEDTDMTDAEVSEALYDIAQAEGLPVVLGQDSHYTHEHHRPDHETLKRLVSFSEDPDDAVFPGDGYHMVDDTWMQGHFPPEIYRAGIEGLQDLLGKHDLTIPELDNYSSRMPVLSKTPLETLTERVKAKSKDMKPKYHERVDEELRVIDITGAASYLLLVAEITDYCRENGIIYQARGSAAGSMVCWLLGITPIDPIRWGLLMERFLSEDRRRPPDIDLDVEHERRQEVMDYLDDKYAALQVGTWGTWSIDENEEGVGSLVRLWMQMRRKRGQSTEWDDIPVEESRAIRRLSAHEPMGSYGTHAAGHLVASDSSEFNELVPTMWIASSKTMVSQYDMHSVEETGLVKVDLLGLKTLTVISKCLQYIGRDPKDGLEWIPLNDKKTYSAIRKGDTVGVFQLEGGAATFGVKDLKPTKIEDIVASMALFRPAAMKSGASKSYINRKHKKAEVHQLHPVIMKYTDLTYGVLIYQEQVISILRELGVSAIHLSRVLSVLKASNKNVAGAAAAMREEMDYIRDLASKAGFDKVDLDWLAQALLAYSDYGFNRSHAAVYGITAYRTAYLATHYPVEYFAALMEVYGRDDKKLPKYLRYVRSTMRMRVAHPDINSSGVSYAPGKGKILKGFQSVKGIGEIAATSIVESQPYESFADFVARCNPSKVSGIRPLQKKGVVLPTTHRELESMDLIGTVSLLTDAGAFRSLFKE